MFLAYLRGHNCLTGDNDFSNTDEAIQKVWALRTDLGTIQFIFDLRVEGQLYFPIENMLVSVIKDDQFVEEMSNIDSGHIKVLYLAVHFFDEEEQKRQILTNIVNACNLKFIEYMQNQSELLDTQDLHNYRKNGVIIFIDSSRRKILIRHNDPEYFKGAENIQYENSFKNKERRIGYYVELDIPEGAARASFEDVMKKQPEKRMELLKLFYSGYKNIFVDCNYRIRQRILSRCTLFSEGSLWSFCVNSSSPTARGTSRRNGTGKNCSAVLTATRICTPEPIPPPILPLPPGWSARTGSRS